MLTAAARHISDKRGSLENGNVAVQAVINLLMSCNKPSKQASEEDDRFNHIDIWSGDNLDVPIQIKSQANCPNNQIVVETQRLSNPGGWLKRSKAKYLFSVRHDGSIWVFDFDNLRKYVATLELSDPIEHMTGYNIPNVLYWRASNDHYGGNNGIDHIIYLIADKIPGIVKYPGARFPGVSFQA